MRRAVDAVIAVTALVVLSPLFAAIALLVFVESGRPIFYGGIRIGRGGREFPMWKFRSMSVGADRHGSVSGPGDRRITRVGGLLRATKLDEFPQLVNLLLGHVTLVGPRPEVPSMIDRYDARQREILRFTPGITSPGEIFFTEVQEKTIPANVDPEDFFYEKLLDPKLAIDFEYFERQTWRSDIGVIIATVKLMSRAMVARVGRRSPADD